MHVDQARTLIQPYLGTAMVAECDGAIFDDQPETFTLRFADPAELREEIAEAFTDEMDLEPWPELAPIAAVSVPAREDREFAWIFVNETGAVWVATHDNWSGELTADGLDALGVRPA